MWFPVVGAVLRGCTAGRIATRAHGCGALLTTAPFWLLFQIVGSSPVISCRSQGGLLPEVTLGALQPPLPSSVLR